jgi:hypothetical protein
MPTDFNLYQGGVGGATGNKIYQSQNPSATSG